MLTAFYDEEVVELDGDEKLRMAVDFRAIDLMEHIVGDSNAITPATVIVEHMLFSSPVPISISCKVLYALLRRHHEDVTLDQALGVIGGKYSARVALAMQDLLRRAFNYGEPEKKAKGKNPRKPRGASKTSSRNGLRSAA